MEFNIDTLVQLINSVGFPVLVAGALFWKLDKEEELHREETTKLTDAINNNTQLIRELIDKLGVGSDEDLE